MSKLTAVRRRKPPDPPAPAAIPRDRYADLAMSWRGRAADLSVASLRLGTTPVVRALNRARADVYMSAARELEAEMRKP